MGVSYGGGGYAPPPGGWAAPPRRINWGWIGESWQLFTQAAGIWIAGIVIYEAAGFVLGLLIGFVFNNKAYVPSANPFGGPHPIANIFLDSLRQLTPLGHVLSMVCGTFRSTLEYACLYRMALKQVRGGSPEFSDLFKPGSIFWKMFLYLILYYIACIAGFAALCVGSFVVQGLLLPGVALVADGDAAGTAFKRSVDAMKGDWASAGAFVFTIGLLILASMIPCGLGMLATLPMYFLISALAYRDMIGMPSPPPTNQIDYGAPREGVWPPPPNLGGGG